LSEVNLSEFRLNPKYVEVISEVVNQSPYFALLSMKIKNLEWGSAVLEVDLEEKHLQPFGYVHGGVIASVMDAAAFWTVFLQVKDGMGLTTVKIKVNYLAPVQKGRLVANGRCIKVGKPLALGDVFINGTEGNLLAHGTATMMIVPGLKVEGQENLTQADLIFSDKSSIRACPISGSSGLRSLQSTWPT